MACHTSTVEASYIIAMGMMLAGSMVPKVPNHREADQAYLLARGTACDT